MTLRAGHGNGAGVPRIEVMPADELPIGVQDSSVVPPGRERRNDGTFAPGSRTAQSAGGRATAGKTKLSARLGLSALANTSEFAPYRRSAAVFRRTQCAELARSVGGGVCGPAPSSLVASASLQLAWSRFLSDRAATEGDASLALTASRFANDSRQNLLAAHELCAREALSRKATNPRPFDPLALYRRSDEAEDADAEPAVHDGATVDASVAAADRQLPEAPR